MLSQYYIKQQNKKRQAEKFPLTAVKCTFCECIYPINKIDQHMNSHISPHYMVPFTKQNNIKKMETQKLFVDDKENQHLAASLKTVYPEDLPCKQTVRRQIALPPNVIHVQKNIHFHGRSFSTQAIKVDQKDVVSNLNLNFVNNQKQFIDLLNIEKPVSLNFQTTKLQKKNIQTYQKEITSKKVQNKDNEKARKKFFKPPHNQNQTQNSLSDTKTNAYKVQEVKQNKENEYVYLSIPEKESELRKVQSMSRLSIPVRRLKSPQPKFKAICTKSESLKNLKVENDQKGFSFFGSFFKKQKQEEADTLGNTTNNNWQNVSTSSNFLKINSNFQNNQISQGANKNNQCPDCGGFYCATCKSTIPPQYRPSNIMNSSYNSQFFSKGTVNTSTNEIKKYYDAHFTNKLKCEKSILNSKQECNDCNN